MTKEQALSHVERTLNHPAAMRIINYLFERGAIIARRKVTISEMERDLGMNRGYIYRLIVGDKNHRSYLRGFVHYPDKGLREGFYLLPAGILAAIGASPEEIAEMLIHRKENSINTFRQIIQFFHRLNSYKLPSKVREILIRDNLSLNAATSRLTRLLNNKTAIKILKALCELEATSWKSAATITEISKTSGLNKGTIYKLTTKVYPKARKNHTKSKPPVLHGIVHYPKPYTKEGKYYIYPKWVPFVKWLINATEEDIQRLLNSDEELEKIATLFLTSQNSGFPQVAEKTPVTPQVSNEVSSKLPIPYSFNYSSNNKKENLPASSGSEAATARSQLDYESAELTGRKGEIISPTPACPNQSLSVPLTGAVAVESGLESLTEVDRSTADGEGINYERRFRGEGEGKFFAQPCQPRGVVASAGAVAAESGGSSLAVVDRSTTESDWVSQCPTPHRELPPAQPSRDLSLPTSPATEDPATAAPATNTAPPQLSGFNISIEACQDKLSEFGGAGAGGRGSVAGRRLHYYYVRSDDGEIICKIPYRPKPSQEELAAVWRGWFVPSVRARILSFAKLYKEGRCARCLELVGRERLKHFHISWQRRLWRVVKRYGLDSAALQLLAFNKTYVCGDCFSNLFIIASLVAGELRRVLKKHVGYDVFEPVCMRCGSRCPDCTDREVRWAYIWNREIALNKLRNFLADFGIFLSKFEAPKSVEEARKQLLKLEALIRKNFDGADYWSWAEWNDYPLGEDEDDWEKNYEYLPPPSPFDYPDEPIDDESICVEEPVYYEVEEDDEEDI